MSALGPPDPRPQARRRIREPRKPTDPRREKRAIVLLARELVSRWGFEIVRRSVPQSVLIGATQPTPDQIGGHEVTDPSPDADFDWVVLQREWIDRGGTIDLVAYRPGETLVIEAAGIGLHSDSPWDAVEKVLGRTLLWMRPNREDLRYGILIPRHFVSVFDRVPAGNPMLAHPRFSAFLIDEAGQIEQRKWS